MLWVPFLQPKKPFWVIDVGIPGTKTPEFSLNRVFPNRGIFVCFVPGIPEIVKKKHFWSGSPDLVMEDMYTWGGWVLEDY